MHGLLNKMVPKKKRRERIPVKIILNPSLEELERWGPTAWVFDTETTGLEVAGATAPHSMRYIGIGPLSDITICYIWHVSEFTETIRNFLNKQTLIAHNAKFDIHAAKLRPKGDVYDTALMVYHSDTLARKRLDDMARVLGLPKIATPELLKEGRIDEVRPDIVQEYLADDVATTNLLANTLIYNKTTGWKIQHDASKVFAKAEHRGIRFVPENFGRMVSLRKRRYQHAQVLTGLLYGIAFSVALVLFMTLHIVGTVHGMVEGIEISEESGVQEGLTILQLEGFSFVFLMLVYVTIVLSHVIVSAMITRIVGAGHKGGAVMHVVGMLWLTAVTYYAIDAVMTSLL